MLTIAHLDHNTGHNTWDNLRAVCQRCHNQHDAAHRAKKCRETWERKKHPLLYLPDYRTDVPRKRRQVSKR